VSAVRFSRCSHFYISGHVEFCRCFSELAKSESPTGSDNMRAHLLLFMIFIFGVPGPWDPHLVEGIN